MPGTRSGGDRAAANRSAEPSPAAAKKDEEMEEDPGAETTMLPSAPSSDLARGDSTGGLGAPSSTAPSSDRGDPGSSVRPIKRSRRSSEGPSAKAMVSSLDVNEFEGVDLAGISRKFPQEKRVELAARIDASAEAVARRLSSAIRKSIVAVIGRQKRAVE